MTRVSHYVSPEAIHSKILGQTQDTHILKHNNTISMIEIGV